ncbi:hypothetical protein LIER_11242 [Lithospermum erythrorhizon]|uniref:Retrotransposon gag domain-containing protein n=1 Tax=Lithospermum erythrorhizon TaxID=34254 RepID=A0AAV3PNJ3_LITER
MEQVLNPKSLLGPEVGNCQRLGGNRPHDLPKPQAKEAIGGKEVGDLSPHSSQPNREGEKFDEAIGKAHESPRPESHREKDTHQLTPSVGNSFDKNPHNDHGVNSQQSRGHPRNKSKSYVEEISRGEYHPRRRHQRERRISQFILVRSTHRGAVTAWIITLPPQSALIGPLLGTANIGARTKARHLLGLPHATTDRRQHCTRTRREMLRLGVAAMSGAVMRISWPNFNNRHQTMPKGFRMPKFMTFDGMGDPGKHLKAYDSQLSFWASEDDVYARAFPSSLSGTSLKWFHKLPPNSIDYWQDTKVLTNRPAMDERVSMIAFFHGLQFEPMKERLVLEPAANIHQLSQLTVKYIKLEEAKKVAEEYSEKLPKKEIPRSPERKPVWDRLQRNPLKRPRGRSRGERMGE